MLKRLIYFFLFLVYLASPSILFSQDGRVLDGHFVVPVVNNIPFDTILSVTQDDYGCRYIFGILGGEKKLSANVCGNTNYMEGDFRDVDEVFYSKDHLLFFGESQKTIRYNLISNVTEKLEAEVKWDSLLATSDVGDGIAYFNDAGILKGNCIRYIDKLNNHTFISNRGNLYFVKKDFFLQNTILDNVLYQPRFAYPVLDAVLVGMRSEDKLYYVQDSSYIDVCNLPINDVPKLERQYYHACTYRDQVFFTDNRHQISKLDLTNFKLRPYSKLNDLNIKYKNNTFLKDETLLFGSLEGTIVHFDPRTEEIIHIYNSGLANTFRVYEDDQGLIWIGCSNGLAIIDRNEKVLHKAPSLWGEINTEIPGFSGIAYYNDVMLITAYRSGIYESNRPVFRYNPTTKRKELLWEDMNFRKSETFKEFEEVEIEHIRVVNDLLVLKENRVLHLYRDTDYLSLSPSVGFVGDMHNFFFRPFDDGDFTVPLFGGYARLDVQASLSELTNRFCFAKVTEGEQPIVNLYDINKNSRIKLKDNYSYLSIEVLDMWSGNLVNHSTYYTDPEEKTLTSDKRIIFADRAVKKHTLFVDPYSQADNQSELLSLEILVERPWYKTWVFIFFALLVAMFMILYVVRLIRFNNIQRRKIKSLETESLRSYMNPHFISNSLNSINYYILKNDKTTASSYIVKFSKLIRRILGNSDQEFIKLEDELDALTMYIEIEQMRFVDKFTFEFLIDKSVSNQKEIPSFILQPIVENAIWHGLVQKKQTGQLLIKVRQDARSIIFDVIDDGIGLEMSKKLKSKTSTKRKSYGIKLIKKRLEILNDLYKHGHSIEVQDLSREGGEGTRVEVRLDYLN